MASSASKLNFLSRGVWSLLLQTSRSPSHNVKYTHRQVSRLLSTLRRSVAIGDVHTRPFSTTSLTKTIFTSNLPDLEIPQESLGEYLLPKFDTFGDKTALVDFANGKTYTYSELKAAIISVASALNRLGYKKGDVMAMYSVNNSEYCILLLACAASGIILTTANPAYTPAELARHLNHSGSTSLVVVDVLLPVAKTALDSDPNLKNTIKEVVVIGEAEGYRSFSSLLEDDGKSFPDNLNIDPMNDVVVIPYSSGTTGLPKGVQLTHYNLVANLQQFRPVIRVTEEDTSLGILPFYHCYGMIPVMMGVFQDGGKLVTLPKFDPVMFLTALAEQKVTMAHIVPPIVVFMAKHPAVSEFDLSNLKRTVVGAAPLGEAITEAFTKRLNIPITQGYGLTETSPVLAVDNLPPSPGTTGRLAPNTMAKVVNPETGAELGTGETGELVFKGPQIMKGYLNNQQATDDMIKDGWLYSGDVGHVQEDGCIVITDRLKELIKYKGFQVPPAELEDLLLKHPGIQDAAVIGIPDEDAGELPRAYVVSKPDQTLTEEEVCKFVEDNVSGHKKLRGGVQFMKEIPKSPSGKILRRVLRDELSSKV
ncbi:probable 4-coumarate--CoA ligase 1 [Pecten maximus]|uniref:probable 4-coumarate--CoA ligase 1 n=1 Tax=Pecten maximus TaxID=6579 RepID=UPI001458CA64|nr:probable 4-coumarate--CoA ligase 1 [Pecten maximus]XP_033733813.1 probable 4-coumarate--CoA ligase 1 [Pecten maximus]